MIFLPDRLSFGARNIFFAYYGIFAIIIIGSRYEIGGDWVAYSNFYNAADKNLTDIISFSGIEPGYMFINWLMNQFGFGIYGVNFICGSIFIIGLVLFVQKFPFSWLAVVVAVPYLLVVVVMGYSRQGVAIGFELIALSYLTRRRLVLYYFFVICAILFHKTAAVLIVLGFFGFLPKGKKVILFYLFGFVSLGFMGVKLYPYLEHQYLYYIIKKLPMESSGALMRVLINLFPAIIFFIFRAKWKKEFMETGPWFIMALGISAMTPFVGLFSTAVDRIMLYLSPLQLVVWSHLPVLIRSVEVRTLTVLGIVIYYGLILFIWMNYAQHASRWVPYKSILGF